MDSVWIRIEYEKVGDLRLISHLDLLRVMERAIRRCGLPLSWRGGFNPRPRLSAGDALPLGVESRAEVVSIALEADLEPQEIIKQLGEHLPSGVNLVRVTPGRNVSSPDRVDWELGFQERLPRREELLSKLERLDPVPDQKGRLVDVREIAQSLETRGNTLAVSLTRAEGRSLKPELFASALGLGNPLKLVKKAAFWRSTDTKRTKDSNVSQTVDQRGRSGRAPDRYRGEQYSPGDPYLQPEP